MNIYFDTEFTGLYKECSLISIGLISEDGKEFYSEVNNLTPKNLDTWIQQNVLNNTILYGNLPVTSIVKEQKDFHVTDSKLVHLKYDLTKWLQQFNEVQLVSDCCHYDMVLFISIFGTAFDLPNNVCATCHDINQDIANIYNKTDKEAFNLSRELILQDIESNISGNKHNALYDAKVIRDIYRSCYY